MEAWECMSSDTKESKNETGTNERIELRISRSLKTECLRKSLTRGRRCEILDRITKGIGVIT